MSSASSEAEELAKAMGAGTKQKKTRKSRKQRANCQRQDSDYEEETLAEKLTHLLSTSGSGSSDFGCETEVEEDDFLEVDENGCVDDINAIADALEQRKPDNRTFNDFELREIERKNSILMNKILSNSRRPSQYKLAPVFSKISSSSINRKKQQQQIDRENLLLLKKIKSVKPFGLSNPSKK